MTENAPASLAPAPDVRVCLATAPPDEAERIARQLVEERLAACVNVLPGVRSLYRWEGRVADDPESVLVIKTATDRLDGLAARLGELHPHEVPELLVLAPEAGLTSYLAWVGASTRPADGPEGGSAAPA